MAAVSIVEDGLEPARLRAGTPKSLPIWLMIAEVKQGDPVGFQLIAQRGCRMVQQPGGDTDAVQVVRALAQVTILACRSQLVELHWKIGVFHLPGQHVWQATVR